MRKLTIIAVAAVLVTAFWCWSASPVKAVTTDTSVAQTMAQDFAPWISAIIQQKYAVADRLFPLQKAAQAEVESSDATQIYSRFTKLDDTPVSLVGLHVLGDHIGTALFTTVTDDGPVAIKVSYYRYGTETRIGKVEFAAHWTEIEALALTVDPLPAPVTALLESRPQ